MAASQIPNLNTLRRGRIRGPGANPPVGDGHATRHSVKDRVVQGTDVDASVSRLSAVELGYLDDPYAANLTPPESATRRFPIINRGIMLFTHCSDTGINAKALLVRRDLCSDDCHRRTCQSLPRAIHPTETKETDYLVRSWV